MAENQTEFDRAFAEMEADFKETKSIRKELIENLRDQAAKMKISEYDKPMMIQAKITIMKTLDDVLKSDEDLTIKKIKMRLARKDSETNGMVGQTITNLLRNIRCDETFTKKVEGDPNKGAMEALQARTDDMLKNGDEKTKKSLTVLDGELTECEAAPSSDNPHAKLKPLKRDNDEE